MLHVLVNVNNKKSHVVTEMQNTSLQNEV